MNKLTKLAIGVAVAVSSTGAFAGSFEAVSSSSVGVEAATTGELEVQTGASLVLEPGAAVSQDNRVYITLSDGSTFADSTYTLEVSGTGDTSAFVLVTPTPAGASTLEFRVASDLSATQEFVLSGSSVIDEPVTVEVPSGSAGSKVTVSAKSADSFGDFDFFKAAELFRFANEFSANVDSAFDAIVDVDDNRLSFTGGAESDDLSLDFNRATVASGVTFTSEDVVDITLSGDMSGIKSLVLSDGTDDQGEFEIDRENDMATFSADASTMFASGSGVITANVFGSAALDTASYTVMANLDFDDETDKNLIAENTAAGQWGINGLQAKVSHLSLNATGFVSWLKVINEGSTSAEISADMIYTLADGTEGKVDSAVLGTADAGSVFTVSEASMLAAMGNPTGVVDVHVTVTVAGQVNKVHLTAEKKASNGRVSVPVYYDSSSARNWMQ